MSNKTVLTDRFILSRCKAKPPRGTRLDYHDALVPGMALRVTDRGHASFVLMARYPRNPLNFTRRNLGAWGEITLDQARTKARQWHALIKRGVDPRDEADREFAAEAFKRQTTLAAVVEDFIREKLPAERAGAEVERSLRRDLLPELGRRSVVDITRAEIRNLVKHKKRTAPVQARNLLGDAKRLFAWAVDEGNYGLAASPCGDIKPRLLLGEKKTGDRVLSETEIFSLWRNASRLPYPYRQIYELLTLTALRLNEVVDASWSEFNLRDRVWTIPKERMKGKNAKARPHEVPLTAEIVAVLATVPNFENGDFLFSLNGGETPVWVGSKVKHRLDRMVLRTLRAMARRRGDDPGKVELPHFTNHDIRRSVRTTLSGLKNDRGAPITTEVKEAILGHVQPGIKGIYDKHHFLNEKQEALELWAAELRRLAEPRVVSLVEKRRRPRRED